MATEKTDVVIIGVGGAGGILAAELGKAGMKVIGLERGPRLKTLDFEKEFVQTRDAVGAALGAKLVKAPDAAGASAQSGNAGAPSASSQDSTR